MDLRSYLFDKGAVMRARYLIPVCCLVSGVALLGCGRRGGPVTLPATRQQGAPATTPPGFPTPFHHFEIPEQLTHLDIPDQLVLYSIDGRDEISRLPKVPRGVGVFHGYPVLGKVEIADTSRRKEITAALKEMAQSEGSLVLCFWPRHAIRAVNKGRTIDFVICFECGQMEIDEGSSHRMVPITDGPRGLFNRLLKEEGIPLAPDKDHSRHWPPPPPEPPQPD